MDSLCCWLSKGRGIYWSHKYLGIGFVQNMTFRTLKRGIDLGIISFALKSEEKDADFTWTKSRRTSARAAERQIKRQQKRKNNVTALHF